MVIWYSSNPGGMFTILPRDRASPKCMIFLLCFGSLIFVLEVSYFVYALFFGIVHIGAMTGVLIGAIMLILGYLLYICNDRKGAFGPEKYYRKIDS